MNEGWHRKHPLGRGASLADRIAWHSQHAKVCACREMPASIRAALESAGATRGEPKPKTKKKARAASQARPGASKVAESAASDPRFAAVVKALGSERGVTYGGKGFGSSALKLNDKIFAMWTSKDAFVVKLSKERVAELVAAGKGRCFDPGRGRLMKEWLEVTAAKTAWLPLAKEALAFGRNA